MDKGSALEGFAALYDGTGNADAVTHQVITTKCVVDDELVVLCQKHGDRPHKGDPLGKFPELWPFDMLKRKLVGHAELFVSQISAHGFEPVSLGVGTFKVWGPYMEKVGDPREWVPEEGNHLIPRSEQRKAQKVWGYGENELDFSKGCAFLIQGEFLRDAKYGHIDEESGVIFV